MTPNEQNKTWYRVKKMAISAWIGGVLLIHCGQPNATAKALLYDNTDHLWGKGHTGPRDIRWVGPTEVGEWFEAQPFKLGGHDNIASVSIPMARGPSARATGTIRFSIRDDNGRGFPGEEVGELGILDVESLPKFDFPGHVANPNRGLVPNPLPTVTFDSPIDDLIPGDTYFVFIDYRGLSSIRFDDALVGLGNNPAGTNRADNELYSKTRSVPPFKDSDWFSPTRFFGSHQFLQMSVTSADDPYRAIICPVGETYHEEFLLGDDGLNTSFLPAGWAFSDNARATDFDGRDLADEERILRTDTRIFDTSITEAFPANRSLGRGTPVFNAGAPGDPDRALALGVTRTSEDAMLQLVAEVAGGDANSIQLGFDIEAWDAAISRDNPGEAAFHVALDLDTGDGFYEIMDLGQVSTGATLVSPIEDFVDGNDEAYRTTFDSGLLDLDLPEGSLLRVRWMADLEAETRGWVFGLDNVSLGMFGGERMTQLVAGDADQDLDFDQLDLVKVQIAAKYLTGTAATWGEGDWNGAPGGEAGNPPAGDGLFNQFDIIAANLAGVYLQGPYAAIKPSGKLGDGQTSLVYNASTGELAVDAAAGTELTSINVTSAAGRFLGDKPVVLDGAFDNFASDNLFKATFGGSFGSISFGNVLPAGIAESAMAADLSAVGSLAGGGDLGNVDLIYVPEPTSVLLLTVGLAIGLVHFRRVNR